MRLINIKNIQNLKKSLRTSTSNSDNQVNNEVKQYGGYFDLRIDEVPLVNNE